MQKVFTTEQITDAQISDWKEAFKLSGGVFAVAIPSTDEEDAPKITGYFRKPTIEELGMVSNATNKVKSVQAVYKTCLLGGDPSFQMDVEGVTDEDIVKAAMKYFQQLVKTREGEVKKL